MQAEYDNLKASSSLLEVVAICHRNNFHVVCCNYTWHIVVVVMLVLFSFWKRRRTGCSRSYRQVKPSFPNVPNRSVPVAQIGDRSLQQTIDTMAAVVDGRSMKRWVASQ